VSEISPIISYEPTRQQDDVMKLISLVTWPFLRDRGICSRFAGSPLKLRPQSGRSETAKDAVPIPIGG
jgi:hypothetical protein